MVCVSNVSFIPNVSGQDGWACTRCRVVKTLRAMDVYSVIDFMIAFDDERLLSIVCPLYLFYEVIFCTNLCIFCGVCVGAQRRIVNGHVHDSESQR